MLIFSNVAISNCLKPLYHFQELISISVIFVVDLYFISPIQCASPLIFCDHLLIALNSRPSILWDFMVDCAYFNLRKWGQQITWNFHLRWFSADLSPPMWERVTGLSKHFHISIRNGIYFTVLHVQWALCFPFLCHYEWLFISQLRDEIRFIGGLFLRGLLSGL